MESSKVDHIMAPTGMIRTTLALPAELLGAVDRFVEEGQARSRNELIATALRHELAALEQAAWDAQFRQMATDSAYQQEAREILAEFAQADREAWLAGRVRNRRRRT